MDADPYLLTGLEERLLARADERRTWATWGTIYLLHFSRPFRHAKHYLGFSTNPQERIAEHLAGKGSSLTRAVVAVGITLEVTRLWSGDRSTERQLKNRHNLCGLCPRCVDSIRERSREAMRRIRGNSCN